MNNTLLYVLTVLIWGSTWIAINYQLGEVAPETSLVYRFGLAALVLFLFCRMKNLPLAFTLRQHAQLIAFGVCLFGVNYYFLYLAQQHINSALTCIGFSTMMIVNILNARLWYKTKITKQVYYGAALGLFGIITLFWPQINDIDIGANTLLGLSLCLIGTVFASSGNMLSIKNQQMKLPVMQSNAWGMAYGTAFMAVLALVRGVEFNFSLTLPYVGSLLYLSIFGSVIAFGCYLTLLGRIGAHKASYATVMFPAVAVVISTFVEGFVWDLTTVIGFVCIMLGNLVVLSPAKQGAKNQADSTSHQQHISQEEVAKEEMTPAKA
ncbi:DMT family transporter [Thalassomonas actiniarum]|uniref:DMT family transporter n=1 Tax=Thalassomonas actiniarum TaxID=485447 RepID=A0AAE9YQB0_9GAMM|nr:DMT family transporter [Thalassomonas actiniarum]WDD98309.1 DMT family transporter [Thalassomonas actiniarum]